MENHVQACITNVSFPMHMEQLQGLLEKNRECSGSDQQMIGDLDVLLASKPGDELYWTAPKWLTRGDILFFYHAATAPARIRRLLKAARASGDAALVRFLEHSDALARQYAGTVFGYATVSDQSVYLDDDNSSWHFKGKIFAPLGGFHRFDNPLSAESFSESIKISRVSALTYLSKPQFDDLKRLMSRENRLPEYLQNARFTDQSLRAVTKHNWHDIAVLPSIRFSLELQLRAYLLDYFLAELKDRRSPLLQECQCRRNGANTGFADYFVKIHDQWVPVEAKLNVQTERDIFSQVAKYVEIDSFTPTVGVAIGESFKASNHRLCVIIDQFGVYFIVDGIFVECEETRPVWKREELGPGLRAAVRERIRRCVAG